MVAQTSLLVTLVALVDRIPVPTVPRQAAQRRRGRPQFYDDRLFLKALVIMIVRRLLRVHELLSVLAQPTPEMQTLRLLLSQGGRYPARRTWERRLAALPATLPAQIGCLGRCLTELLQPWASTGRAVAIDSTLLRALGGVWHKKYKEAGVVPHSSIDTAAAWTKSGHHGWVYGWKLHLISSVAAVWIPLAARLTPANAADNEVAPALLVELPAEVRFVLGDTHYHAPNVQAECELRGQWLVASGHGRYPHVDDACHSKEVRRVFHKLRSVTIENFNEQFKGIFQVHSAVPTRGLIATQRFALGAIFVYQLALLYRFEHQLPLRVGLKAFLRAA